MGFGISLPGRGHLATLENLRAVAVRADELGLDAVWLADHIVVPRQLASQYPYSPKGHSPIDSDSPYCEALTTLAYLAGCTERIRLGVHVLVLPYRNPVLTAKVVSTLDYLSGGRVTLGVGVGWMEEEFKALGLTTYRQRGEVSEEYLRIIKGLWTEDSLDFHGHYHQFSQLGFAPKPVQKPHPPIWVGGHSGPAMRRAALLGDGWMPVGQLPPVALNPPELAEKFSKVCQMAQNAGRDPEEIDLCFSAPVTFTGVGPHDAGRTLLSGTPEAVAQDVRAYQQVGVKHFVLNNLRMPGDSIDEYLETAERFAKEVMPLLG